MEMRRNGNEKKGSMKCGAYGIGVYWVHSGKREGVTCVKNRRLIKY
jgi:hypothetical protein